MFWIPIVGVLIYYVLMNFYVKLESDFSGPAFIMLCAFLIGVSIINVVLFKKRNPGDGLQN